MLGFYNIIKPTGVSSGYVVNKIKWITKEKVGHLGTLDPLASGVLPIAVGKATRFFDYFLNKDKVYFALMKLGFLTDTLDSEGKIVEVKQNKVSLKNVKEASKAFFGEILQVPPLYSARSVGGVRGYQAAINNQELKLESRKVNIYSIEVEPWVQDDVFAFKIHCSSGTYVRSLLRDIAAKLDCVATTVSIIRLKSGAFSIDKAITLDQLEENATKHLLKVNEVINKETISLNENEARALASGKNIKLSDLNGDFLLCYNGKEFSYAEIKNGIIQNKIYLYEGTL